MSRLQILVSQATQLPSSTHDISTNSEVPELIFTLEEIKSHLTKYGSKIEKDASRAYVIIEPLI